MPAPPLPLIALLRSGHFTRRTFFKLTHSGGTVRVCDGIGNYELDGEEYLSVGGLAALDGISDSGDIQNHSVIAKLNGVALASLATVDPNIRGETATIKFAWIDEAGNAVYSRTMAVLKGSHLQTKFDAREHSVAAHLRGPTAQWQTPPRAYYTDKDQQRRFAGDTGFSFVKYLENANASGWSVDEETTGGVPTWYGTSTSSANIIGLRDSLTLEPIGDNQYGVGHARTGAGGQLRQLDGGGAFAEDTTAAPAIVNAGTPQPLKVGGTDCYVDISGDVRSPGGAIITPGGTSSTTNRLRKQGTISADGSATAETLTEVNVGSTTRHIYKTSNPGVSVGGFADDQTGRVYCNRNGRDVFAVVGVVQSLADSTPYVEAVTGTACVIGSGKMQVSGSDCKVSTTGVILSNAGRRIVKQGGDAEEFLRVWT